MVKHHSKEQFSNDLKKNPELEEYWKKYAFRRCIMDGKFIGIVCGIPNDPSDCRTVIIRRIDGLGNPHKGYQSYISPRFKDDSLYWVVGVDTLNAKKK